MHSTILRIARARALSSATAASTTVRRPDALVQSHRLIGHKSTSPPTQAVSGRADGSHCSDNSRSQVAALSWGKIGANKRGLCWNSWNIGGRRALHNQAAASDKETEEVGTGSSSESIYMGTISSKTMLYCTSSPTAATFCNYSCFHAAGRCEP